MRAAAILAAAALTTSCSDVVNYEDDIEDIYSNSGAPVITAIYDVKDTKLENALQEGSLNQMIRITGNNLAKAKSVTFNGIEVDVRSIYATTTASYMKIPREIPEAVDNKIVYTTDRGTVTYDFRVNIPHMSCEGLANEFALPGESVQVKGEFFDLFGFSDSESDATITMTNEAEGYSKALEVDSLTEEYMGVLIPEDAPDNSVITLTWTEPGNVAMQKTIPYRYTRYMLFDDLNTVGWWDGTPATYITDGTADGDPETLGWDYFRFKGYFPQWQWTQCGGGANWPDIDCTAAPADYVFKFEVCNSASYPFYDSAEYGYLFSLNGGTNYPWNPSSGMSYNTYGEWKTISIPLDKVASNGVPAPGTWSNFVLVMQPNTDGGWNVDHSFANFRIEPKDF